MASFAVVHVAYSVRDICRVYRPQAIRLGSPTRLQFLVNQVQETICGVVDDPGRKFHGPTLSLQQIFWTVSLDTRTLYRHLCHSSPVQRQARMRIAPPFAAVFPLVI